MNNDLIKIDKSYYKHPWELLLKDINFKEFYEILQIAFEWKDYHLHEFNIINEKGEQVLKMVL